MNLKKIFKDHKITVGLVLLAFLMGAWFSGGDSGSTSTGHTTHSNSSQVWTCSMHPSVQLPEAGQCPICFMDLIPLEKESGGGINPDQLTLSEDAVKLAEIETATVVYGKAENEIRLSGKVAYDESRIGNITAWVPGRVERVFVDYTGIRVNKGDHMIELYSPDLYAAQEELLQARNLVQGAKSQPASFQQSLNANLLATREKLRLMGLVDAQIKAIEAGESPTDVVTIYSPMSGVVIQKNGVEGAYVKTGTNIYTIADLDQVWVILDAYETDLPWLAFGQDVTFTTEGIPGKTFSGRIAFIDPVVDHKTRTVKVRINVSNPDGQLKPGMFVHGAIQASIGQEGKAINPELAGKWVCPMHPEVVEDGAGSCPICEMDLVKSESLGIVHKTGNRHGHLLIPASAVLKTGDRAIVYIRVPGDAPIFEGREIVLGPRVNDQYVVISGLMEGELVVVKGNFKIDSAMQISAKPSMMNPKPVQGKTQQMKHQH